MKIGNTEVWVPALPHLKILHWLFDLAVASLPSYIHVSIRFEWWANKTSADAADSMMSMFHRVCLYKCIARNVVVRRASIKGTPNEVANAHWWTPSMYFGLGEQGAVYKPRVCTAGPNWPFVYQNDVVTVTLVFSDTFLSFRLSRGCHWKRGCLAKALNEKTVLSKKRLSYHRTEARSKFSYLSKTVLYPH